MAASLTLANWGVVSAGKRLRPSLGTACRRAALYSALLIVPLGAFWTTAIASAGICGVLWVPLSLDPQAASKTAASKRSAEAATPRAADRTRSCFVLRDFTVMARARP